MKKHTFWCWIIILTFAGIILRWTGIGYEGVDYQNCLSEWYAQLKEVGSLQALTQFKGNYNLPYATALLILTYLPVSPLAGIKMLSIIFDFLSAAVLMTIVRNCSREKSELKGLITYGLVLCSPISIINSAYLAQSDGIYAAFTFLSFWLILKNKPIKGMAAFGCALAMKLQAIFVAPILVLIYFCKKKFSALHFLWIPVTIQVLCIPAILAGCGWDIAIRVYSRLMGEYPYMYYYYPNLWTYFQGMPYYAFGKYAMMFTFGILLLFCILVVKSKRQIDTCDYLEYFCCTAMTCAMFLPCMHERYNYIAEILIISLAVVKPRMRMPAIILNLASLQCYLQSFFWTPYNYVSPYLLAAVNLGVYTYVMITCIRELWKEREDNAENREETDYICGKTHVVDSRNHNNFTGTGA